MNICKTHTYGDGFARTRYPQIVAARRQGLVAYDVNDGNKRIKGNKLILGRVYFSYQFNVKGINMRLQENQNMASTFMSFNIDDIKLNTYIRLDDSLLESSVKNIKVVDNKAVDDWDNGTVFEVTDSDDTVSSNTNDNSSSNSEDEIDASSSDSLPKEASLL